MRNKGKQIKSLAQKIGQIKSKFADSEPLIPPPIGDEEIEMCSSYLTGYGFPPIPQGYAEFLKICNGYAFDGVELYGTEFAKEKGSSFILKDLGDITFDMCKEYEEFLKEYEEFLEVSGKNLLWFGKDACGDSFTYDNKTGNYQHRSHRIRQSISYRICLVSLCTTTRYI
jgi:hypothetical protein